MICKHPIKERNHQLEFCDLDFRQENSTNKSGDSETKIANKKVARIIAAKVSSLEMSR